MNVRLCLVVTDDPDDIHAFTEAAAKVSENTVVVIIVDSAKALKFLASHALMPEFLVIDLSMNGLSINHFLRVLRQQPNYAKMRIMTFGDFLAFQGIEEHDDLTYVPKALDFSKLTHALADFFRGV